MSQAINNPTLSSAEHQPRKSSSTPWYQRRKTQRTIQAVIVYALLLPGAVIFLFPLLWMLSTAVKPEDQIFLFPPKWIPDPILWRNFWEGWTKYLPFSTLLINTLIITGNNIVGNLVSCCLAAYGFARLRARGKHIFFMLVLGTMLLPSEVTLIPQYVLFSMLKWNDSWLPLTIPAWFGWPFFIFLLRQFFMNIPHELDEAARLDGASSWRILWEIILPLSKPALATVVIFAFIGNWNNFLPPLIYIRSINRQVLAVGLNMFQGQYGQTQFGYMMSVSLLVLLPVLIVFFIGQRVFIQGIATSGLKG